jgi:hypothetical protein
MPDSACLPERVGFQQSHCGSTSAQKMSIKDSAFTAFGGGILAEVLHRSVLPACHEQSHAEMIMMIKLVTFPPALR